MEKKSLDINSKFKIASTFTLSNDDVSVLSLLYAPLIGSDSLMIYLGFQSLLERNNLTSEQLIHQDLFDIYSINPKDFLLARYKLEAIGLVTSFVDNDGNYTYFLSAPLSAKSFIKDATLGLYLYSNVRRETFDFIYNHFKVEAINKANLSNITKTFDEVFTSRISNEFAYDKFKYILGKNTSKFKINNNEFDTDKFLHEINKDFLETGVTKTFIDQINTLAYVYSFDELEMVNLYHDSINRSQFFDYRLLKKKANIYFKYKRNMDAPKLITTVDASKLVYDEDLKSYLENVSPKDFLEEICPNYPDKYMDTVLSVYANIDLPRGVLNSMIVKVVKQNGGEMPAFNYFKKVSQSWIKDGIFTTDDAIKYVTEYIDDDKVEIKNEEVFESL
jgi:replication initiation and membrane attachment protein